MHNQEEIKKILDQGMLTRSIIESEVAARKCAMYSEMAQNKDIKSFFKKQASAIDSVVDFFKSKLSEVM
jgi:vacuolar-type H+-ATPase subunit E/Vma4